MLFSDIFLIRSKIDAPKLQAIPMDMKEVNTVNNSNSSTNDVQQTVRSAKTTTVELTNSIAVKLGLLKGLLMIKNIKI